MVHRCPGFVPTFLLSVSLRLLLPKAGLLCGPRQLLAVSRGSVLFCFLQEETAQLSVVGTEE